jgi:hypothetical protein
MATMMYSPQAAQMVAEITKPAIFEDRPEDWDRFDREWRKYEQLITATGLIMPDAMRLEALRSRVGPASKLTLQELEDKNPRTEFSQYYQALVRQYSRDATGQARLAWQKVRLQTGSDGLLNLNIFKKFQGEFKVYRNRVGDWNATEEYDLLLRNLPVFWIQQLKIEKNKRQRSRFWVKLTNAPDMSAGELREALEEAGRRVKGVRATDGGYLILAEDEEGQVALEGMSGHMIGDHTVKISRTQIKMTGDEILDWMDERLRVQDEAQECIAMHDRQFSNPRYFVQEITQYAPTMAPALVLGEPTQKGNVPLPTPKPVEIRPPPQKRGGQTTVHQNDAEKPCPTASQPRGFLP